MKSWDDDLHLRKWDKWQEIACVLPYLLQMFGFYGLGFLGCWKSWDANMIRMHLDSVKSLPVCAKDVWIVCLNDIVTYYMKYRPFFRKPKDHEKTRCKKREHGSFVMKCHDVFFLHFLLGLGKWSQLHPLRACFYVSRWPECVETFGGSGMRKMALGLARDIQGCPHMYNTTENGSYSHLSWHLVYTVPIFVGIW